MTLAVKCTEMQWKKCGHINEGIFNRRGMDARGPCDDLFYFNHSDKLRCEMDKQKLIYRLQIIINHQSKSLNRTKSELIKEWLEGQLIAYTHVKDILSEATS